MMDYPGREGQACPDESIMKILEGIGVMGSVSVDANGDYSDGLGNFIHFLGGAPYEMQPLRFLDIVYVADRPKCTEILNYVATTGKMGQESLRFELSHPLSKLIPCQIIAFPAKLEHPSPNIRLVALPEKEIQEISSRDLQNHKLLNIGALSTAIAHDLCNLHAGILTFTTMLIRNQDNVDQLKYIQTIEETVHRANELTSNILQYARGYSPEQSLEDPIECIQSISKLARNTLSSNVKFSLSLPEKSVPLNIQRCDLCQIFLNLFFNAKDAIKENGYIRVEGKYTNIDAIEYFVLEVEDSGPGISPKDLGMIFEPFYTTKKKTDSSGLGLAIIKQIITRAEGDVKIQSQKGQPTCFSIFLPTT
ncbi:MAG: signal transduction histidine kinase [Chlamydiales bacterium]|jgi:signal transduction histidine kinase